MEEDECFGYDFNRDRNSETTLRYQAREFQSFCHLMRLLWLLHGKQSQQKSKQKHQHHLQNIINTSTQMNLHLISTSSQMIRRVFERSFTNLLVVGLLLAQGLDAKIPVTQDLPLNEMGWLVVEGRSRTEAFDQLAYAMSLSYPMTEWKEIDWDAAYDRLKPKIDAAVRIGDTAEYFRLVREFALTPNDGHLSVASVEHDSYLFQPSFAVDGINASFGFAVTQLEDGSAIAIVQEGGSAEAMGLESGMEVVSINDQPIHCYIDEQPVDWTNMGMAHQQTETYFKGVRVGLGALGGIRKVEVRLADSSETQVFAIPSKPLQEPWFPGLGKFFEPVSEAISYDVLENNVGYLSVNAMITQKIVETRDLAALQEFVAEVNEAMTEALEAFESAGVEKLIFDLRGNSGGMDQIGAEILGFFIEEAQLYSSLVPFDFDSGDWNEQAIENIYATPGSVTYEGRVVVLADLLTFSAAEGLLDSLQQLPNCRYVGYWGSNGSYTETGGLAILPGEIIVQWPLNPKLDDEGGIRIDTTAAFEPTLLPDIEISREVGNTVSVFLENEESIMHWANLTLNDPLFGYFPGSTIDADGVITSPDYGIIRRWDKDPQVIHQQHLGWVRMLGEGGRAQLFHRDDWGQVVTSGEIFPMVYSEKLGFGKVQNGVFIPADEG